jgi:hypothetical protein
VTKTKTIRIELTQRQTALIDIANKERVRPYDWHATFDRNSERWYARAAMTSPDGTRTEVMLHRFLLDEPSGTAVQFIDGNPLNCTAINMIGGVRNRLALGRGTSRFKGVSFVSKKKVNPWRAEVRFGGMKHYIGGFPTEEEAASAFDDFWETLGGDPRLTNRAMMARRMLPAVAMEVGVEIMPRRVSHNASGYRGVTLFNKKWHRATIWLEDKTKLIGYFTEITDAARAYDREAFLRDGDRARLNFPNDDPMVWVAPPPVIRVPPPPKPVFPRDAKDRRRRPDPMAAA